MQRDKIPLVPATILPVDERHLEATMAPTSIKDYVKVPKREYHLLKEVYRTVKRQAFLVRLDDAEKNLAVGKTKAVSVDDLIASV